MRKKLLFFIGIVLLCAAAWGLFLFNKPHSDVGSKEPDMRMQADELYQQYKKNEAVANTRFLNKIITVTGIVDEINETKTASII
ncbi:MAG: OB-fold putative lipoprotein, partial [Bacteroidota bacterium]|nr:OB-fold putative lipoprotein [Bacteroidota bacterium]